MYLNTNRSIVKQLDGYQKECKWNQVIEMYLNIKHNTKVLLMFTHFWVVYYFYTNISTITFPFLWARLCQSFHLQPFYKSGT